MLESRSVSKDEDERRLIREYEPSPPKTSLEYKSISNRRCEAARWDGLCESLFVSHNS